MTNETGGAAALAGALTRLHETVESRRGADPGESYTAKLLAKGRGQCAKKLGEEAVEAALAIVQGQHAETVAESADLLYHLVVAWVAAGVSPGEVAAELARREGVSGIAEKEARKES